MGPRPKRHPVDYTEDASDDICKPATPQQKNGWNGFCEIESEPVRDFQLPTSLLQLLTL